MKTKDSMIPNQERLKLGAQLIKVANILRTAKRDDEKSGVKGGLTL